MWMCRATEKEQCLIYYSKTMLCLVFLLPALAVSASLIGSITNADHVKKIFIESLSNPYSLRKMHAAAVGVAGEAVSYCNCEQLKLLFQQSTTSLDIFYGLKTWKICRCPTQPKITEKFSMIVNEEAQSSKLVEFCGASLVGYVLDNSDKSTMDVSNLHNKLSMLSMTDGTFVSSFNSKYSGIDASIYNTEVVLLLLNTFHRGAPEEVIHNMLKLLVPPGSPSPGRKSAGYMYAPYLFGAVMTAGDTLPVLDPSAIANISTSLVNLLYSEDVVLLSAAMNSLYTVSTLFKNSQPLFLQREEIKISNTLKNNSKPKAKMRDSTNIVAYSVRNVLGKVSKLRASAKAVFSLTALTVAAPVVDRFGAVIDRPVIIPSTRMNNSDNMLQFDLSSILPAGLPVGKYEANISVHMLGRNDTVRHREILVYGFDASLADVTFEVSSSRKSKQKKRKVNNLFQIGREGHLTTQKVVVNVSGSDASIIHIHFRVCNVSGGSTVNDDRRESICVSPGQVVVSLTHSTTLRTLHYPAVAVTSNADVKTDTGAASRKDSCRFAAVIGLKSDKVDFYRDTGIYVVHILVGDVLINTPIKYLVGEVEIVFPPKPETVLPVYQQSLLHASNIAVKPLPEIIPVMCDAALPANKGLYQTFSVLVFIPLLVLCWFYGRLVPVGSTNGTTDTKPSCSTVSSTEFIHVVKGLYLLCLVLIMLALCLYWFETPYFSFFESVNYLLGLSVALFICGRVLVAAVSIEANEV